MGVWVDECCQLLNTYVPPTWLAAHSFWSTSLKSLKNTHMRSLLCKSTESHLQPILVNPGHVIFHNNTNHSPHRTLETRSQIRMILILIPSKVTRCSPALPIPTWLCGKPCWCRLSSNFATARTSASKPGGAAAAAARSHGGPESRAGQCAGGQALPPPPPPVGRSSPGALHHSSTSTSGSSALLIHHHQHTTGARYACHPQFHLRPDPTTCAAYYLE